MIPNLMLQGMVRNKLSELMKSQNLNFDQAFNIWKKNASSKILKWDWDAVASDMKIKLEKTETNSPKKKEEVVKTKKKFVSPKGVQSNGAVRPVNTANGTVFKKEDNNSLLALKCPKGSVGAKDEDENGETIFGCEATE